MKNQSNVKMTVTSATVSIVNKDLKTASIVVIEIPEKLSLKKAEKKINYNKMAKPTEYSEQYPDAAIMTVVKVEHKTEIYTVNTDELFEAVKKLALTAEQETAEDTSAEPNTAKTTLETTMSEPTNPVSPLSYMQPIPISTMQQPTNSTAYTDQTTSTPA